MRALLGLAVVLSGLLSPPSNINGSPSPLSGLWNVIPALGVAAKPEITVSHFDNLPTRLYYFDDTTTVLYFDGKAGNVHISEDEGKSWKIVDGVPQEEARQLIEHPFDNRVAFILTRGKTHYKTEDRGRTWRTFHVPLSPAFTSTPLSFHRDPRKGGYILYQGVKCKRHFIFGPEDCHDETFYTKDGFADEPKLLLSQTSKCIFAHSSKDFKHTEHSDLIFCLAFDATAEGTHSAESSRLLASSDFFGEDRSVVDFGIGSRLSRGVVAMGVVSKFLVAALQDLSSGGNGEMVLYVTVDARNWAKAHFPHSSSSKLHENSYTIVESTTHSLAIDVQSHSSVNIGTLFVSNSNGTYFVESLRNTHRSDAGYVDFEDLVNIEGVGLANYIINDRELDGGVTKEARMKSVITYDDGSSWDLIKPPTRDMHERQYACDTNDIKKCSLHLHSVSTPHNFGRVFSSTAPGFVMGVGSVGDYLAAYDSSDTYFSRDAGVTWKQVYHGAHKYEFGDQGNIIVIVYDEQPENHIRYSIDSGETWHKTQLPVKVQALLLTTIPDSTSQKFILLGQMGRTERQDGQFVIIHLDFAATHDRQCGEGDLEKWYARGKNNHECIMGHKQWFLRRKLDAKCYIGNKFKDPESHYEDCLCTDADYECDYNYVREGEKCVPVGPEPIPSGVCVGDKPNQTYEGSSGYRLIPGNTCKKSGGVVKDEPVTKSCDLAAPQEGAVVHQIFKFPAAVVSTVYFRKSQTVMVQLIDSTIWQSSSEGFTWQQLFPEESFLTFYMHTYSDDRAYLFTTGKKFYYTTDAGKSWNPLEAPLPANRHNVPILAFHPTRSDYLIWSGDADCPTDGGSRQNCRVESHLSFNNGRQWALVEKYVKQCAFARDSAFKIDETAILCESYRDKKGQQETFNMGNPLELVYGSDWYAKKQKLFNQIVGFATFSEYLLVAEITPGTNALDLQVSLDGYDFSRGLFPPDMRLDNRAYTILESSTDAVFLHVTMSSEYGAEWGNLLKSNSNGTYYGISLPHVNRNTPGYVDYEKMIGIDGVVVANIVTNPDEARHTRKKKLNTMISHNDGGSWQRLTPPRSDSTGAPYACKDVKCSLHIHGYTERRDPRATFSSPSVVGLMLGVGNVGEILAPYTESDTFLTRDAGFTWEEVHKDAHMWEFGDSGSILVIVNDEEPTDHVQFTTDEGLHWREYNFGMRLRITSITTVPADNSRKFMLIGYEPRSQEKAVVVYLDFSQLTAKKCKLDIENGSHDDFELWSPSEEREEQCLFGAQTFYYRRVRDANCYVGTLDKPAASIRKNCTCTEADFECEYNHTRNPAGECVLASGATPLPSDSSCPGDAEYWYERTPYRKIPKSTCVGGNRPDRGAEHVCPGLRAHGSLFWWTLAIVPFGFTALVAFWYYRRGGYRRGTIRLPEAYQFPDSGPLATLASIPWFLLGMVAVAWNYVEGFLPASSTPFRSRRGYRHVPVDEDAQVLRFEDEE